MTYIRTASSRALPWRGFGAAAAALVLAACSDRLPTQTPDPVPPGVSATRIECTVTVASGEMRCGLRLPGGPSPNLLLGGQGIYLRLVSSGTHYDGSEVFESSVLVQNLLDQPMGSADGTTVYGMNVLFASGPSVTSGTGTVTVANPDGVGTFTASGQPYFHYDEILAPRGSSQAKLWRFSVPPTVATFAFTLLVETRLQNEPGILRWERKAGKASGLVSFLDVWGTSPRNVYAVGTGGTIMHFDGSTWAVVQRPVLRNLYAVGGAGARSVYAVGEKGVILHSSGNGWTVQDSAVGRTLGDVAAPTPDTAYVVGWQREAGTTHDAGILMRTIDGGAHWTTALTADSLNTYISAAWAVSPTEVYAAGYRYNKALARYQGVILHSGDAGASWATQISAHNADRGLYSLWADGPGSVYAAGYQVDSTTGRTQALVLHSTDGGATWGASTAPYGADRVVQAIWGTPGGALFAAVQQGDGYAEGTVLRSTDGGATWNDVPGSYPGPVWSVWGDAPTDVYAVGPELLMRYDGSTWTHPELAADAGGSFGSFEAVWTPDNTLVFAAGWKYNDARGTDEGLISRSTDGGATWTRTVVPGPTGLRLRGIWGTSANDVFAVGDDAGDGIILHSGNGGDSWQELPVPTADARQLYSVWGTAANDVYAAGLQFNASTGIYEALILHSTNGGATWAMTTQGSPIAHGRALAEIRGASATELYAVGWDYEYGANVIRGLVMRSTDGGASWVSTVMDVAVAEHLWSVWAAPGAGVYAVGARKVPGSTRRDGVVLFSSDGGANWSTVKSTPGVTYEGVWGSGAGHVYAVGGAGTITRFDGTGWLDVASGSGDDLTAVFGTSSTSAWAAGLYGTVLRGTR